MRGLADGNAARINQTRESKLDRFTPA